MNSNLHRSDWQKTKTPLYNNRKKFSVLLTTTHSFSGKK